MPTLDNLAKIDWPLFVAVILPGFVSIYVYRAIRPTDETGLKDLLLEAAFFGILNAGIVAYPFVLLTSSTDGFRLYAGAFGAFVLAPALWPLLFCALWDRLARRGLVLKADRNAWDHFFRSRQPCWIVVVLKDGTRIGGYFGTKSFASLHPKSGHLYIEELWPVDQKTGAFVQNASPAGGILLRPEDYQYLTVETS